MSWKLGEAGLLRAFVFQGCPEFPARPSSANLPTFLHLQQRAGSYYHQTAVVVAAAAEEFAVAVLEVLSASHRPLQMLIPPRWLPIWSAKHGFGALLPSFYREDIAL